MKKIFIEWSKYGSRSDSLAEAVGAIPFFLGEINSHRNIFYSFLTYIPKTYRNFKVIRKTNPDVVFISNTNWVIALVNLIFAYLFKHKLVFDSHSCAFDHEFIKYPLPLSKYFARKADLSIITNESYYKLLTSIGAKAIIISDIPFENKLATDERIKLSEKINVCYVCNYSADEPFREVFDAAGKLDKVIIHVTGNYNKTTILPNDYPHVNFTGYLSANDYKKFINSTDIIMTLTTRENTMQRAGSEAISVGKPLITSDTQMLRNYFKRGTVFVNNTSNGIVSGILEAVGNLNTLQDEILIFRNERKKEFSYKLETLKEILELQ